MTTALVDLSNACRGDGARGWDGYLLLRRRLLDEGFDRVRAIGDRSLRHHLPAIDIGHLDAAVRKGEVQLVPYADPDLVEIAFADAAVTIVTNDRFKALRPRFPELDGFARVMAFRFDGTDVHLHHAPLERLSRGALTEAVRAEALEPSRRAEKDLLDTLGYRSADDRELLSWDWCCDTSGCPAATLPQLDALPVCDRGIAVCGECHGTLRRLALAIGGLEIKALVGGEDRERFALAAGSTLRVGRGAGPGRFDVTPLIDDGALGLVSRRHLEVANLDGRLRVRELGSSNGTRILRADGSSAVLAEGTTIVVDVDDRVSLAGVLELQRSARRWPRASFVRVTDPRPPGPTMVGEP